MLPNTASEDLAGTTARSIDRFVDTLHAGNVIAPLYDSDPYISLE